MLRMPFTMIPDSVKAYLAWVVGFNGKYAIGDFGFTTTLGDVNCIYYNSIAYVLPCRKGKGEIKGHG